MSYTNSAVVECDTSFGPNDVLLGRGNHFQNSGNEKFRSLVRSRSIEYCSCDDNIVKDNIARQIVDSVASQHGRFLRKVKIKSKGNDSAGAAVSARDSSVLVPNEQWEVADTETVLVKIKQTFRDFTASDKKRIGATGYKTSPHSSSDGTATLQHVSILERLQHLGTLTSPPFRTLPDSNNGSPMFSSPTNRKTEAEEMLFQHARASQLDHLAHNTQQQLHNQNSQDHQLMSLFEQQRAILMTQLQQSSLVSGNKKLHNQPAQQQQPYHCQTNPHHHLSTQPASTSFTQEPIRLASTDNQIPQTLLHHQMHQSHQDAFLQGQNDPGQNPSMIDQQLRVIPRYIDSVLYQPQCTLANQNVKQSHIYSSLSLNTLPNNLHNWSLQPSLYNNLSIPIGVQPPVHDQPAATQQCSITERFNEYLNQGNTFPLSAHNMSNTSPSRSTNEFFAVSDQVHLPGALSYPQNHIQQQLATTDTDRIHRSASLLHTNEDKNNDDDKKPPAL